MLFQLEDVQNGAGEKEEQTSPADGDEQGNRNVVRSKLRASSSLRAPMDWPTLTSAPTLLSKAMEPDIHVSMPTAPTAATDSLPRRPTHAMSVRL